VTAEAAGDGPTDQASPSNGYRVCESSALIERGEGIRFELATPGGESPPAQAFVIRHGGRAYAYLNECAHVPVELDWQPGRFFDAEGEYLICATHGATYRPQDGVCVAGPCRGRSLKMLVCEEHSGQVWVRRT
jgi:nitrite reductase/ring-hydroxylating ferredoxin subunit